MLDSFLWLGIEVFMGWSAVFSQGAEPNIGFSAQKLQGRSPAAETRKKFEFKLRKQLFQIGVERKANGKNSENSESAMSLYLLKMTTCYKQSPKTSPWKTQHYLFSHVKFTIRFSISQATTFFSCSVLKTILIGNQELYPFGFSREKVKYNGKYFGNWVQYRNCPESKPFPSHHRAPFVIYQLFLSPSLAK